jgi:hypothetical protein
MAGCCVKCNESSSFIKCAQIYEFLKGCFLRRILLHGVCQFIHYFHPLCYGVHSRFSIMRVLTTR